MKKTYLLFILVLVAVSGWAQQQGIFTNYLFNNYYYNPAVAGSRNVHVANMSYRNQWTGFSDDAPVTYMAGIYGSYKNKQKEAYGAMIMTDKTGLIQRTGINLNYAHHFSLTEKLRLGLGLNAGLMQYRIRLYDVRVVDNGDQTLTGTVQTNNMADGSFGFHLYHDKFFLMGTASQLLNNKISFKDSKSKLERHYYAIAGYNWIVKKKWLIQPSCLVRVNSPAPIQIDASVKLMYDNKFWMAPTYRTDGAGCLSIGYNIKNRLNIGYSYDYSLTGIQKYNSGSHEINISYVITKKRKSIEETDEELNNSIKELFKKKQNDENNK